MITGWIGDYCRVWNYAYHKVATQPTYMTTRTIVALSQNPNW